MSVTLSHEGVVKVIDHCASNLKHYKKRTEQNRRLTVKLKLHKLTGTD